jgi:hypothetical protein
MMQKRKAKKGRLKKKDYDNAI